MGAMPAPTVKVTVTPTAITTGQSATVSWSATSGSTCTASGAWSGTLAASGTQTVTETVSGTDTFTLTCSSGGGAYGGGGGSGTASATLTVAPTPFSLTHLVSNVAGGSALTTDTHLVNPWGLVIPGAGAPAWVANNGTQTGTLYEGGGKPQPAAAPLIVQFAPSGSGADFDPTGIVLNSSATDFMISSGGASKAASFIFAGESGMLAGWSQSVDPTHAITTYADAAGAVYKGIAVARNAGNAYLYATDFHNNKVDVFDTHYLKQPTSATAFSFADPAIPSGFAPFGIRAIANGSAGATQLYVTYAEQKAPDNHDNANGAGLGYVDIFDTNGKLLKQLIAKGALNAPWGLALAPADFGTYSHSLLVGNFGDGRVNAYDPATGAPLGTLADSSGTAIAEPGLWGIEFGNDSNAQPHNTLFLAAGINDENGGSYDRIDVGATPPVINAAPAAP